MTWLEEYGRKVISGEIVACHRIKQAYTLLLDKLYHPEKYKPWIFDFERAMAPIDFIETFCKQAEGEIGAPLKLELFQLAKHQAVFGFVHEITGERQYTEVLDIRARKNGKTTELAADALYLEVGDNEGAPEVYFIATKLDQSKKGFNATHNMVKQNQELGRYIRKRQADLYSDFNLGFIQALASNSNGLDGLNSHAVIIDELSAIKNRDIYDLMKQSMSARKQPLLTCITTNGFVRNNIFDSQYEYACKVLDGRVKDDRFIAFIYELDDRDEWDKEECWIKANPGLGTIKKVEFLRNSVQKAKEDPSYKPTVMVKDFNMKENSAAAWLPWSFIENNNRFEFEKMNFKYGIGCFDAADTTDLNAAHALCMRRNDSHIYLKSMYWLPEAVLKKYADEGNRRERDSVPYTLWEKQGLLRTWPGNKVDKRCFLDWFKELRDEEDLYILYIGYDPWHIDDSLLAEFKTEFGPNSMIPIRQGVATLSAPMKDMKADLEAGVIVHNGNPITMWNLSNIEIKTDINGNIQPVKDIRDSRKRIDGGVALICGYVVLKDKYTDYTNVI